MAKQFRNIFLALLVTVNFSSCSYHYFYPQRVNVYAFDSAKQTKSSLCLSYNSLGVHFDIGHSFSNRFFISAGTSLNSNIIEYKYVAPQIFILKNEEKYSNGFSTHINLGFFKNENEHRGYEIIPGFFYERSKTVEVNHYYDSWKGPYQIARKTISDFYTPTFQYSYYLKKKKFNYSFALRFSYPFYSNDIYGQQGKIQSGKLFIEPYIESSWNKFKPVKLFFSYHLCTSQNNYYKSSKFQGGIKFMF